MPPVVAVVVSSDPGPWLEECLVALLDQDYTNLSILVLDAGSTEPIADRVAAVAPQVYLRRLERNDGFGPSANAVLGAVEGATHYLFCHDDIVAEPDALKRMVEEAFRTNAGIVCPKLVEYDDPEKILQVGLGVDRFGAPVRRVERGEYDQAQHDEVREVFAAPGACTLVRADLFSAIGGFDEHISMFGEDVDLCWRARLAGARVLVVPQAVVRHREATAGRMRPMPNARDLQWRHELRAVLKNYGPIRLVLVGMQLVLLSLVEVAYFTFTSRRYRVRQVLDAWRWNLSRAQQLREARAAVAENRRLPDRVVSQLFSRRTSRVWRFVRPMLETLALRFSPPGRHSVPTSEEDGLEPAVGRRPRTVGLLFSAMILVLIFGSRSLIVGHIPLFGQFLPFGSPISLLGHFFGGTDASGLRLVSPASPATGMLGLFGLVLFGAMGTAQKVVIIGLVVIGGIGISRLMRPLRSPMARLGGAGAYLFLPLCWNDIAHGDLRGLIAFGATPYVLSRLARSSGLSPFATTEAMKIGDRRFLHECLALGIVLSLVVAFAPAFLFVECVIVLALVFGCALTGEREGAGRVLALGGAGALCSIVLSFPWSVQFLQANTTWNALLGPSPASALAPSLGQLMRFDIGPLGRGVLGWALIAGALFVLIAGTGERLAWGMRIWVVLIATMGFAWALSQGWLGAGGSEVSVALAPASACVAVLVGLGIATVPHDLRRARLGLGHLAAIGFLLCVLAGLLPVLGASLPGRWSVPQAGYDSLLSWTNQTPAARADRLLWLGDPTALPTSSWAIRPGFALGVSANGLPDIHDVFPTANPSLGRKLIGAVTQLESGRTVRFGDLVAPYGIRYVIVPATLAPELGNGQTIEQTPAPQVLLDGLSAQSDLRELPEEESALVFVNTAWTGRGVVAPHGSFVVPAPLRGLGVALGIVIWLAAGAFVFSTRERQRHKRHRPHLDLFEEIGGVEHEDERFAVLSS